MPIISEPIAAGADDAYWSVFFGRILLNGPGIWQGRRFIDNPYGYDYTYIAGLRFTSLNIPQGAVIDSATITINIISFPAGVGPAGYLFGDDTDDAPPWGTSDIRDQITETTAKAELDFDQVGSNVIDVTAIVQEIVDRPGWSPGNDMRFGGGATDAEYVVQFDSYETANGSPAVLEVEYVGLPIGTVAQTLPALGQAASANLRQSAQAAQTLPPVAQAAAGRAGARGAAVQDLPPLSQAAEAGMRLAAEAAQGLPPLNQAAAGRVGARGAAAQTLPAVTQAVSGRAGAIGTAGSTLAALTQAALAGMRIEAETAQTLPPVAQAASGRAGARGAAAQLLPALTQAGQAGTVADTLVGAIAQTLPALGQAAAAGTRYSGVIAQTLPALRQRLLSGDLPIGGSRPAGGMIVNLGRMINR